MPEFSHHIRASFEPSETKLLTSTPTNKLLTDSPVLATALSQIFPYILLVDGVLETVTWTNEDHYRNFLILTVYSCVVMYWNMVSHFVLPLILALTFASIVWLISSIVYDSKYDEKPTIEEVLYTLHNITIRSEMIFRPIKKFPFTITNYTRLFVVSVLLSPVYWLLVKTIIPPQKFLWYSGLFALTFHSPHAYAIRQLLWRSIYLRLVVVYITGLDVKVTKKYDPSEYQEVSRVQTPATSDTESKGIAIPTLSNFRILRKKMVSPTQLKQTVVFEILENERRWLGLGWSSLLYPSERSNFCYENTLQPAPPITIHKENFPFPIFENDIYSYQWEWIEDDWKLDTEFNKSKSEDGWVYYDSKWEHPRYRDGFSKFTRARKWTRAAILMIDKQGTVYDE